MEGKGNCNILTFKKQIMKQYTQYNLISIFKMNTRKRTDKRKYPKMINTCVHTELLAMVLLLLNSIFLNYIYLACINHI